MQDIEALHALVATVDIAGDIPLRVPDVQAIATWIRKHVEDVTLGSGSVETLFAGREGSEGLFVQPTLAPFLLETAIVVVAGSLRSRGRSLSLRGRCVTSWVLGRRVHRC